MKALADVKALKIAVWRKQKEFDSTVVAWKTLAKYELRAKPGCLFERYCGSIFGWLNNFYSIFSTAWFQDFGFYVRDHFGITFGASRLALNPKEEYPGCAIRILGK